MNNDKPKTDSLGWSDLKQYMRSRCYSCGADLESSVKQVDLAGGDFNLSYSVEIQKCPACHVEYFSQSYFDKPKEIINQIKDSIDPTPFTNVKPTEEGVFEVFFDVFKYTRPNFFIVVTEFDGALYAYYNWKDYFKDGALVPLDDLIDERLKFRKSHKKFDSHFKKHIQDTAYRSLKKVHESKFSSFLHKETRWVED